MVSLFLVLRFNDYEKTAWNTEKYRNSNVLKIRIPWGFIKKEKKCFSARTKLYSLKNYFSPKWPLMIFIPYNTLSSHQSCMVSFNTTSSLCFVRVLSGFNIFLSQQCNKYNLHHFLFSLNSPMNAYTAHTLEWLSISEINYIFLYRNKFYMIFFF